MIDYDTWLLPQDEPDGVICLAKCPRCHGMADGVKRAMGHEIDEDGHRVTEWEVTGIRCQECGYAEGDECYPESEYNNL